jgi:hypothetical protein
VPTRYGTDEQSTGAMGRVFYRTGDAAAKMRGL